MKIIEPKAEFFTERNPLKRIERIARVCWKTEDRITDTSAREFCAGLLKMGHTSPFEHARVIVPNKLFHNRYTGAAHPYGMDYRSYYGYGATNEDSFQTMNARDFLALGGYLEDLETMELANDFATVLFTVDIGISRELCRHRQMSFMEQSTRYVNMKDGIEFVRPLPFEWATVEYDEDSPAGQMVIAWWNVCAEAELHYKRMIEWGCTPQEARTVLPLSTATRLYVTGTFKQWGDLLKLRLGKGAHPSMKYDMRLMLENPDCPRQLKDWETLTNE